METAAYDAMLRPVIKELGGRCVDRGSRPAELATTLRAKQGAVFGVRHIRRDYWFQEAFPSSDAILALARVLEALSQQRRTVSARRAAGVRAGLAADVEKPGFLKKPGF